MKLQSGGVVFSPSQAGIFLPPCCAVGSSWRRFSCMSEGCSLVPPGPELTEGLAARREGALLEVCSWVGFCVPCSSGRGWRDSGEKALCLMARFPWAKDALAAEVCCQEA